MIMRDMVIKVTGLQQNEDGPNATEIVTQGQYGCDRDQIFFKYQETELTGMEGTTTSVTVTPKRVQVDREGSLNTQMIFEEGNKNYFLYNTPYGSATMGLSTNRINCRLGEHGGYLEIDYYIDMESHIVGRNRFFITIREPEKSHIGDISWPT